MRGQRGTRPIKALGYVNFTKVIFRRCPVSLDVRTRHPRREKFEQQRRTAWRYVSSIKATCGMVFFKRLFGTEERFYNLSQIQWL